jgi:hypothetical protein
MIDDGMSDDESVVDDVYDDEQVPTPEMYVGGEG